MKFLRELWLGKKSLVFTFWGMRVVVFELLSYAGAALVAYDQPNTVADADVKRVASYMIVMLAYSLFIIICVWRSAGNYIEEKEAAGVSAAWGYRARLVMLFWTFSLVIANIANLSIFE